MLTTLHLLQERGGALQLVVGGVDGRLRLLDATTGKATGKSSTTHDDKVGALTVGEGLNGEAVLASGGADCSVLLWDARSSLAKPVATLGGDTEMGPVRSLLCAPGGRLLAGDDGNNLKSFDLRKLDAPLARVRNSAFAHEDAQCALALGQGGALLAAAAELSDDAPPSGEGRQYLTDRLDGCVHVFVPRTVGWEYRSTLADETGLISSIAIANTVSAPDLPSPLRCASLIGALLLCQAEDEEVMAFGSFDSTVRPIPTAPRKKAAHGGVPYMYGAGARVAASGQRCRGWRRGSNRGFF